MKRRDFLRASALTGGTALLLGEALPAALGQAASPKVQNNGRDPQADRLLTVAGFQMLASRDLAQNEKALRGAIDKAAAAKADFLLTPEGSASGYYDSFDRFAVAQSVKKVADYAKAAKVGLLLGTCYKELEDGRRTWDASLAKKPQEYCYDQVRVYAPTGEYLGAHSKILLGSSPRKPGTGEMKSYVAGTLRTFTWNGICFGVLICNDLWATPGSTTIPNPYLPLQLKNMGVEILFHAVSSGTIQRYRPYHESTQALWARSLNIPIVTANATRDGTTAINCRSGVIGQNGDHVCESPDAGEQLFVHRLILPAAT